ncbi:MAG: ABC transporter ATP-binding protein [Chitinophagales bacterium]
MDFRVLNARFSSVNVLEIKNLTQDFGGLRALDSVSLTIKEGQVFGLIGPNGAGKTTLFNLVTGIYRPTSGEILFQEQTINKLQPHLLARAGIGRTFQNIRLFKKMSVLDNVKIGMHAVTHTGFLTGLIHTPGAIREEKAIRNRCIELLKLVGLENRSMELAASLAYGEQRRLEIARALALNPVLLLLDEPAAGMNATEKEELLGYIRQIQSMGITILLVEHDMNVVMRICECIAVLNYGRKIAEGTPDQVANNEQVIKSYLGAAK